MAVVSISSGLSGKGKQVAERLSSDLGYQCVSREILLEASEKYNIPEIKLIRAIQNAPTILDRFFNGKEKYVAFIRHAILSRLENDNIVYHGLAGHFFVQEISHVLKVLVVSDMEDRIQEEVTTHNTSPVAARQMIEKDDLERVKWGQHLYGIDPKDPSLFDLVVNLSNLTVEEAVEVIKHTSAQPSFKTTDNSINEFSDRLLEATATLKLIEDYPTVKVRVVNNKLHVGLETGNVSVDNVSSDLRERLAELNNELKVEVTLSPILEAS